MHCSVGWENIINATANRYFQHVMRYSQNASRVSIYWGYLRIVLAVPIDAYRHIDVRVLNGLLQVVIEQM